MRGCLCDVIASGMASGLQRGNLSLFAWHTRTAGGFIWELLLGALHPGRRIRVIPTGCRSRVVDLSPGHLSVCRSRAGVCVVPPGASDGTFDLAAYGRGDHLDPGGLDLAILALQQPLGELGHLSASACGLAESHD